MARLVTMILLGTQELDSEERTLLLINRK